MPAGSGCASASVPRASPSPTITNPSSVLRTESGPRPSPPARAVCAPFVPPVSATKRTTGSAISASVPAAPGRVHARSPLRAARPEAPPNEWRQERRREDRARHHGELRTGGAVEGLLESRREDADVGEEKEKADDPKGHLADHSASDYTASGRSARPRRVAMP